MRKEKVWKQALALVLSAALMVGNGSSVFAAAGDTATGNAGAATEGTGNTQIVTNSDAYKALTFDFEDGEQQVSGDDALYIENGITFLNQCSQPVAKDEAGNPVASNENPSMSEGVEVVDASSIPEATDADKEHGKVLKFDRGTTTAGEAGIDYLTSLNGALASYDYTNGVIFSFDIRPEAQGDWNYLFAFGQFLQYNVTGTIGFIAGYEAPWTPFFPASGWIDGNQVESNYNWFSIEANVNKWYTMTYIYTKEGLTLQVNGVDTVTYRDEANKMEDILKNMSKGQLRLGKGVVPGLEGYIGYMDNVVIQPVHPGPHDYAKDPVGSKDATCEEDGYTQMKCTMCGVIAPVPEPATGHDYGELVEAHPATCATDGNIEHYQCSKCSKYFVSGDDGVQLSTKNKVTIAATGHNYNEVISQKATPAADGEITKTCPNCGEGETGHSVKVTIAKASDITLENTSYTYTGKAIEPGVTVKDSADNVIAADNYDVSYANNTKVGTEATVTITFKGDKYEGTAIRKFSITEAASLTLNKAKVTLYTGKASNNVTVKATKVTGTSKTVTWSTSNNKVAKVSKGKITAVGKGTATITAKANGITKTVKVTVKNPTITVKNGKKKAGTVNVKKGKKVTLTVTTNPAKAGSALVKLSAKDKKVANVTYKKGKITIKGKKKGNVTLKITSGKATKTIKVKVK